MQCITCNRQSPKGRLSNTEGRLVPFGSKGIVMHCCLADSESAHVAVPELCFKGAAAVAALYALSFEAIGYCKTAQWTFEGSFEVAINIRSQYIHCSSCSVFDSELVGYNVCTLLCD